MPYDPNKHHRYSYRLKGYDYSRPGAYFFTICLQNRNDWLFGEIRQAQMFLNGFGNIVQDEWVRTPHIRPEIALDAFVVMPNHVHGILWMTHRTSETPVGMDGRPSLQRQPRSLGSFIAGFKSVTTRRINEIRRTPRVPVWQYNYHEHIVRNTMELERIRRYITENPARWQRDSNNTGQAKG